MLSICAAIGGNGGEGGIRTLGPPQGGQRFSRPPRSTAPAPLRLSGAEDLARSPEEQQANETAHRSRSARAAAIRRAPPYPVAGALPGRHSERGWAERGRAGWTVAGEVD